MTNEFYKFDTIEFGDFAVQDFSFQRKLQLISILPEASNEYYIDYINLEQNQTLDMVSYILYGTTDYWDLLSALNDKDPLFELFYSDELVANFGNEMTKLYEERVSEQKLVPTVVELLLNRYSAYGQILNDTNMVLKIIRPERLSEFLKVLKDNDII